MSTIYRVTKPRFHNGVLHSPDDPRHNTVTVEKPYPKGKVPAGLVLMSKEEVEEKKNRDSAGKTGGTVNPDKETISAELTEPAGNTENGVETL